MSSTHAARPVVPRRRRRRPLRIVLAALVALVVVVVAGTAVFALSLSHTYDAGRRVLANPFPSARPAPASGTAAQAVNILLLGTDVDASDPESPQTDGKPEADTVIVIHVPADRKHLDVVSIPRNADVAVAGHGRQPIAAAYAQGGARLTVQTVETLLGTRMDHVVQVSLTRFAGLTDALGGVTVDNPAAFTSHGVAFPAGAVRLDGRRAVAFVRGGDFRAAGDAQHIAAQSAYFRAVFGQLISARTLLDPLTLNAVVSYVSPYLTTDKGLDAVAIAQIGLGLRGLHSGDLRFIGVPVAGIRRVDGDDVERLDSAGVARLGRALQADALQDYSG